MGCTFDFLEKVFLKHPTGQHSQFLQCFFLLLKTFWNSAKRGGAAADELRQRETFHTLIILLILIHQSTNVFPYLLTFLLFYLTKNTYFTVFLPIFRDQTSLPIWNLNVNAGKKWIGPVTSRVGKTCNSGFGACSRWEIYFLQHIWVMHLRYIICTCRTFERIFLLTQNMVCHQVWW